MSWPQPTAQYGQTPAKALASLIFSETAAASIGSMSTPAPSAPAVAVALPDCRKSRRDRLMDASFSPLWTGHLVPDGTEDDDPARTPGRPLELDDVAGVERGEIRAAARIVGNDESLLGAGQIRTRIGGGLDADGPLDEIDGDDNVTVVLEGVGEAHKPGLLRVELRPEAGGMASGIVGGPTADVNHATAYPTVLVNVFATHRLARAGHTSVAVRQECVRRPEPAWLPDVP